MPARPTPTAARRARAATSSARPAVGEPADRAAAGRRCRTSRPVRAPRRCVAEVALEHEVRDGRGYEALVEVVDGVGARPDPHPLPVTDHGAHGVKVPAGRVATSRNLPTNVGNPPHARRAHRGLAPGRRRAIDRHRHDEHQLVYVSTGVLAVRPRRAAGSPPPIAPCGSRGHLARAPLLRRERVPHASASRRPARRCPTARPRSSPSRAAARTAARVHRRRAARARDAAHPGRRARPAAAHARGADHAPRGARPAPRRRVRAGDGRPERAAALAELARATNTGERTLSRLFRTSSGSPTRSGARACACRRR